MSAPVDLTRPHVKDLRSHLICGICMGFFVDATTINECLHTFCRSCIVKYLDTSNYCPMCDVQIHKSKPLQNLRPDKMLQDLVYKVVPGFYASEVKSRREFYVNAKEKGDRLHDKTRLLVCLPGLLTPEADSLMTPELRGEPLADSKHFSPDESISLSLEYYIDNEESNDDLPDKEDEADEEEETEPEQKPNPTRRYYKCPAAVCIRILKKLLRSKYGLRETDKVDIIYQGECLPEHFTLMDVGYIFSYKKKGLLKFYFRFYSKPQSATAATTQSVKRPIADNAGSDVKRPRVSSDEASGTLAGDDRKAEQQISQPVATSTRSNSPGPLEEPEKRPVKEKSPAARLPSPKRSLEKKEEQKLKRPAEEATPAPPAKKPKPAEHVSPVPPPAATTPPAPKQVSEPPKPIQPGLKPPSQTSLLLKQQIAQQREQQKKMQIKQQQQQQMLKMQRQQQLMKQNKAASGGLVSKDSKVMMVKQMPQLQKMSPKQQPAGKTVRPVMPQPTTASIGTQSLPIVSKTPESAPKATAPSAKLSSNSNAAAQTVKLQQQAPAKPTTSSVSVSTSTAISKPVQSSQTDPPPINTAEQRRLTNDMIEKNKMRPVVVIERHGNGRPKVKQVPSPLKLHQQMSREFNKAISPPEQTSTPKASAQPQATTLTTAPTDSATKVKIVKTPTTSPENAINGEKAKKTPTDGAKPSASPSDAGGETPKGRTADECALDLSGKSSRKSDSPRSSIGSPSPPAPKVPTPEPRKSLPAPQKPPQPQQIPQPPPKPHVQQQQQQNSKPPKQQQQQAMASQKKDQNVIKIAQNSLNEKLTFFRQFSAATASQQSELSKITSYNSLMQDALVRSKQHQHFKMLAQQHQQQQQARTTRPPPPAKAPSTYGPRAGSQQGRPDAIRIPLIGKSPSMATARIHDLFPSPQAKPGPNQAVRHIPNPSLLGRQNAMRMQQPPAMDPAAVRKDEITITPARNPAAAPSALASAAHVSSLRKIETLTQSIQRGMNESKMVASDAAQ